MCVYGSFTGAVKLRTLEQTEDCGKHLSCSGGVQSRIQVWIHSRHHLTDGMHTLSHTVENLTDAFLAMGNECLDIGPRLGDARSVGRPVNSIVSL